MESFDAVIQQAKGGGAYIEVPDAVVAALGGGGRIPVQATFDGVAYRGSIASMGGPTKILGVLKSIRTDLGRDVGDTLAVTVERDTAERTVEVPAELALALSEAGLRATFEGLSYSHQREYVNWIVEAKRPATRERRIAETVERLRAP